MHVIEKILTMEGFVWKKLTVDNLTSENEWRIIDVYILLTDAYAQEIFEHIPILVNQNCHGCFIGHPSQREHECLMDTWSDHVCSYFEDAIPLVDEDKVFHNTHRTSVKKGVIKKEDIILLTEDKPMKEDPEFMLAVYNRCHHLAVARENEYIQGPVDAY